MAKKKILVSLFVCCFIVAGIGCATPQPMSHSFPAMQPVPPPSPAHGLKVYNLLILADVSRSMQDYGKIGTEKAFLSSFNQGVPKKLKNAGMRTFGKSAYHHAVLVKPLGEYQSSEMAGLIGALKAGCGNTPLASALRKAKRDLKGSSGNIAVLIVSDGENLSGDPIPPTVALRKKYGDRICIYAVHIGNCEKGRAALENIVSQAGCGKAVAVGQLTSDAAMKRFITEIFYAGVVRKVEADTDGDGVIDKADKCPGTPKGVKVDKVGCPLDSDGDGVPDYLDKCPGTPKGVKVDKVGCPLDSDGDGVPDHKDKCPNTLKGAPVNSVGCWTLKGITFDTNKSDIKPQFHGLLDENVEVLKKNPTVKVEIQGHTDSAGSDTYNQSLSEKRAKSVKDYLISKGIDAARVSSRGLGESKPIASNDTPEGMAKNRRIEVKIISR